MDPGDAVRDLDLLLGRVDARIGEPVTRDEDNLFGLVVSGADDDGVEGAARRALAAASSLGARETRAGAARPLRRRPRRPTAEPSKPPSK